MTLSRRIPSLDGLRAVSILLVMAHHALASRGLPDSARRALRFFPDGDAGVVMFLVLSGFLITTLLWEERERRGVDVPRFYARRALRIVPVCWLYVFVIWTFRSRFEPMPGAAFAHAFAFAMNFAPRPWPLGHLWTLAVEQQFYLAWPWAAKAGERAAKTAALAIIAWAPVSRVLSEARPEWSARIAAPFFNHADSLMAGCLIALVLRERPSFSAAPVFRSTALRVACVVAIVFAYRAFEVPSLRFAAAAFSRTAVSACAGYLLVSAMAVRGDVLHRFLNHRAMVYLGTLSYSLYVWQQPFLVDRTPGAAGWWRTFPANLALPFVCAALSHHLWERFFLKARDRFRAA